MMLVVIISLYY